MKRQRFDLFTDVVCVIFTGGWWLLYRPVEMLYELIFCREKR